MPELMAAYSMTPCTEEALRLLRLAGRDLEIFRILVSHPEAALSSVCFHAQQCAEKALKAVLTSHCAHFPRTHNLEELATLINDQGVATPVPARELRRLNPYAVEFRYDDDPIHLLTLDEAGQLAQSCLDWASAQINCSGP